MYRAFMHPKVKVWNFLENHPWNSNFICFIGLFLLLLACCWVIWKLTIKLLYPFSLQFLAFDTEASHDILRVWDGPPENEMLLKEISGSLVPEGIHSTLNIVTIQFDTDFYISKSGFAIQFSSKFIIFFFLSFNKLPHWWIVLGTTEISDISDPIRETICPDSDLLYLKKTPHVLSLFGFVSSAAGTVPECW